MRFALAIAALALAFGARAGEPPGSLAQYRCYTCHSDYEAGAGPAFADIAAAYRGKRSAAVTIANGIRAGVVGGGPWHMPPHPEVSPAEARAMAHYILSLQPRPGDGRQGAR